MAVAHQISENVLNGPCFSGRSEREHGTIERPDEPRRRFQTDSTWPFATVTCM